MTDGAGRVLIVDDEPLVCRLLALELGKGGYTTSTRFSAEDALELATREDFDAIVTDLKMNGMDGIELCERLIALRPDARVIVYTASAKLESAVAAIRAGAFDFITKSAGRAPVKAAVDRALEQRRRSGGTPTPSTGSTLRDILGEGELPTMAEVERRYILKVLGAVSGNRSRAADILGFDKTTLYRKLLRYGITTALAPED